MKNGLDTSKHVIQRMLALPLVISLVVFMFSCNMRNNYESGSKHTDQSASPSAPIDERNEKVEITVWTTQVGMLKAGQKSGDWVKEDLVPEWNKLYPNITVHVETIPFDGINERIMTAIASNTAPDVLLDTPVRTLAYAQLGVLAPLDDIIPATDLAQIRQNANVMKMVSIDGQIFTMPYSATISVLILNKSLWKEAQAEHLLPQNEFRTWTPDQFKAAIKAIANKEKGIYGMTLFALNEQGDQLYNNTLIGFGANLFNHDYSKYIAAESPEAEQALAFFKSMVDEQLVHPHPETLSAVNALDYWKQRKTGMVLSGTWHTDLVKNGLKDGSVIGPHEYMYVNLPSTSPGQAPLKMEYGYGVVFKNKDPMKVKWAKEFLYWSQTGNEIYTTASKAFNPFGIEPSWAKDDPELQFLYKLTTKTEEWPVVDPGWGIKGYPEMRAAMFPAIQQMFINEASPKQTLDMIAAKFNEIIAKYNQ